jgi:hypothetical protein
VTSNEELEEQKRRDFMESGVPLEGEFMLIKGVGNSCREVVAEEIFKGTSWGLSVQPEKTDDVEGTAEGEKEEQVKILMLGWSQIGRIRGTGERGWGKD